MTQTRALLVLLDWQTTFDKIIQHEMFDALKRMNVPDQICAAVEALYRQPTFYVQLKGRTSNMMAQKTGIRQGCPLSPYLLIIMSVMYHDVHANYRFLTERQRIVGTHTDEVFTQMTQFASHKPRQQSTECLSLSNKRAGNMA